MLQISGELNPDVGGIPVGLTLIKKLLSNHGKSWEGLPQSMNLIHFPDKEIGVLIYAEKLRGLRDPFLEAFNQPGSDASCELRESSTVAPQALTLLNAEEVQDRALAFADRLLKERSHESEVIQRAFELALGRAPGKEEVELCVTRWKSATRSESQKKPVAPSFPKKD